MYSQQFPVPAHVFPQTMQALSRIIPKKMGEGMNAKPINIKPKPIATVLSCSSTHRTPIIFIYLILFHFFRLFLMAVLPIKKLELRPDAPKNLSIHITAKNA